MDMDKFIVIGDSHCRCFEQTNKNVLSFRASSAKGLLNKNSKMKTNDKIMDYLKQVDDNSNLIFFFGKVDLDFILNYKYNTEENFTNFENYIINTVHSYINFINEVKKNKKVYICELPISHISDDGLLKIIKREVTLNHINSYLSKKDKNIYLNFNKVILSEKRLSNCLLFNRELKKECYDKNFSFLEINKYFKNKEGFYKVPLKHTKGYLDHHLNKNIVYLYLNSLKDLN